MTMNTDDRMPEDRDCQNPRQLEPQPRCSREPAIFTLFTVQSMKFHFVFQMSRFAFVKSWISFQSTRGTLHCIRNPETGSQH